MKPVVLYVEDDQRSRRIMQLLLQDQMGIPHLTLFEDSNNFLGRMAALDPAPNLILLDIHLQPHNGFEMLQMLRRDPQWAETPVIALTASVMNEEVQQLREAGFNSCIGKPLNVDTFPNILEQILNGAEVWSIV